MICLMDLSFCHVPAFMVVVYLDFARQALSHGHRTPIIIYTSSSSKRTNITPSKLLLMHEHLTVDCIEASYPPMHLPHNVCLLYMAPHVHLYKPLPHH